MTPNGQFEFKMWYTHKTLDIKLLLRTTMTLGDDMNQAMTAMKVMLEQVTKNPDDWKVWE